MADGEAGSVPPDALPAVLSGLERQWPEEVVVERCNAVLDDVGLVLARRHGFSAAMFGVRSGFFYLPAAVGLEWGSVSPKDVGELLTTIGLGHAYFAAQDAIVDDGTAPPEVVLLSHGCFVAYLRRLLDLASPQLDGDSVLELHQSHYSDYVAALSVELDHRKALRPFTNDDVRQLGFKASPGNVVLEVVGALGRIPRARTESLCDAVMILCAGMQLVDDLNDLVGDRRRGIDTYPAAQLRHEVLEPLACPSPADEMLFPLAAASGVATETVELARELFRSAASLAAEAGSAVTAALCGTWAHRMAQWNDRISGYRQALKAGEATRG